MTRSVKAPKIPRAYVSLLALVALAAVTLCFRLGSLPFVGADEPRYARVAEEMHAAGRWVTPLLQNRPWLEKPPLYYWITIPFVAVLGPGETAARLGPVLSGLAALLATLWLGRRLFGPEAGFYAALILATSVGFVAFGRSASTDMPLAACLTVALSLLGAAAVEPTFPRLGVALACVFLGLAVLAKGPVALVVAAGAAALFWWLDEREGTLARWRLPLGVPILAVVALPWFVLVLREQGFAFIAVFFVNHHLARFVSDLHHHSEPFYYYAPVLLGLLIPWSGWLPLVLPTKLWPLKQANPAVLWLVCWAAFPLLFFSFSGSKLPGYILPSLPPLALLLGHRFAEGATPRAAAWSFLALSATVSLGLPIFFNTACGMDWRSGSLIALALAAPSVLAFLAARRGRVRQAVWLTALGGALVVIAVAGLAFPAFGVRYSTRDIARLALQQRAPGEPIATYGFFHHTLHYYTGYRVAADLPDREALRQFALAHPRFLVVTRVEAVRELGQLGGFSAVALGRQGSLEVVRVAHL